MTEKLSVLKPFKAKVANSALRRTHLKQEIRSVELGVCPMQLFHFRSRDVHPVQDLLLCTKFHEHRMIFH